MLQVLSSHCERQAAGAVLGCFSKLCSTEFGLLRSSLPIVTRHRKQEFVVIMVEEKGQFIKEKGKQGERALENLFR